MKRRLMRVLAGFTVAIGGAFFLQALFIPMVTGSVRFNWSTEKTYVPEPDPFTLGEYYFNHDSDPGGPYDLKQARRYYEQALLEDKDNAFVWYQLGRIDFLEGDFDAALYKFDKQIELFGDAVPNVYYMIGLTNGYKARETHATSDWQKAAAGFQQYLTFIPDSPWARTDLSWVYFAQGDYEIMIPILEVGLAQNPDHPWLLNMYGLALRGLGHAVEATTYFERAKVAANDLDVSDWSRAYPGNDPQLWADGLAEFQSVIDYNVNLSADSTQ